MVIRKTLLVTVCFLCFIQLGQFLNPTEIHAKASSKLNANEIQWTYLQFQAKSIWVDVSADIHLLPQTVAEVESALIKNSRGTAVKVAKSGGYKVTFNRIVDAAFKPAIKTTNLVWFNPDDATALGRIRQRRGRDDYKKTYRFTEQGVYRLRREPRNRQEISKQPEKWTDVDDTFYTYDLDELGCPNVTERLVLIYIASASEISKIKRPLSFCVFGRRQLFHVRLKPEGFHSLKVDYIEKKLQGETRRRGAVEALKIVIESQPLASHLEDEEDFSFLGFQKNITIFIDPVSGVPVQLSGEIPKAGQLTVKLREVRLR